LEDVSRNLLGGGGGERGAFQEIFKASTGEKESRAGINRKNRRQKKPHHGKLVEELLENGGRSNWNKPVRMREQEK